MIDTTETLDLWDGPHRDAAHARNAGNVGAVQEDPRLLAREARRTRNLVLDHHRERNARWVTRARAAMKALYDARQAANVAAHHGTLTVGVCGDDIQAFLDQLKAADPTDVFTGDPRALAPVFATPGWWVQVGTVLSKRRHSTRVPLWAPGPRFDVEVTP